MELTRDSMVFNLIKDKSEFNIMNNKINLITRSVSEYLNDGSFDVKNTRKKKKILKSAREPNEVNAAKKSSKLEKLFFCEYSML